MIEYLQIKGFKCFEDFEIKFNSGINLLVGENDAGKSSLLSVIRILKGELYIDNDDFRDKDILIEFTISINGNVYKYNKDYKGEENISHIINIAQIKQKFNDDILIEDEIGLYIKKFGGDLRGNKKIKLKSILDGFTEDKKEIEISKNILSNELVNIKFEDGKQFSDIQQNFKNFIKGDVNKIWDEEIEIIEGGNLVNKKFSDLVNIKLEDIKKRKEAEYKTSLLPTIKEIIPSIKGMNIDLKPNLGNFSSYESKVNFYENGKPVNIDKKGDGTKRRITLALFKQESLKEEGIKNIYLFDEPDTHLNLRVQQDLINTFYQLVENEHQVIFTSHSPFILNLIKISNITLLQNDGEKTSRLELNPDEVDDFNKTLYNLGVQNIDIFFSKHFLFYEGETELNFFSKAYYKKYGDSIEKKFIRQINCEGIDNEAIFMKNFCSIIGNDVNIISIVDKDYEEIVKTKKRIDKLNEKFENIKLMPLGNDKEFEDEFSCENLYNCFETELNNGGVNSIENLEVLKITIPKFSGILSSKTRLSKPEMGNRLAEHFDFDILPENIKEILEYINGL